MVLEKPSNIVPHLLTLPLEALVPVDQLLVKLVRQLEYFLSALGGLIIGSLRYFLSLLDRQLFLVLLFFDFAQLVKHLFFQGCEKFRHICTVCLGMDFVGNRLQIAKVRFLAKLRTQIPTLFLAILLTFGDHLLKRLTVLLGLNRLLPNQCVEFVQIWRCRCGPRCGCAHLQQLRHLIELRQINFLAQ